MDTDTIFSLRCVHGEPNYSNTRIPSVSGYILVVSQLVRKDANVLHEKAGDTDLDGPIQYIIYFLDSHILMFV